MSSLHVERIFNGWEISHESHRVRWTILFTAMWKGTYEGIVSNNVQYP